MTEPIDRKKERHELAILVVASLLLVIFANLLSLSYIGYFFLPARTVESFVQSLQFGLYLNIEFYCFYASAMWIVLVLVALVRHRRRGLWLLVGAPFALWYPAVLLLLMWKCTYHPC